MAKKIIKYFFLTFLALVIGALIFRIILSSDKSTFDDFKITDTSKSAYAESGELTVKTLKLKDKLGGAGYFCAYSMYYVEETSELQVTVRYNISAVDYTSVESDEDFEFLLLKRKTPVDLTDLSKNEGEAQATNTFVRFDGEYLRPVSVEKESKYKLYRFKKLVFENVPVDEDGFTAGEYVIVMVPTGMTIPSADSDALTRNEAYEQIFDSQEIHYAAQPVDSYRLTKKNLDTLGE